MVSRFSNCFSAGGEGISASPILILDLLRSEATVEGTLEESRGRF